MQHISDKIRHNLHKIEQESLAQDIWHILEEQHFEGYLTKFAVNHLCNKYTLPPQELALKLLPISACYSLAEISHFHVGAIAIGESGNFYFGANQEFAHTSIQQTIHAEQSAISHAWMRGESALTDIVVNYTPCGHCRQFMQELNSAEHLKIHLPHSQNNSLQQYLPDGFGPKDLNIQELLLDKVHHQLQYQGENAQNELLTCALAAANLAHAPYSKNYHGIAIQMKNQRIFQGSYAENAAFNPSLPALQVALNYLLLNGEELNNIKQIVMVEKTSQLSYQNMAKELALSLGDVEFSYISLNSSV